MNFLEYFVPVATISDMNNPDPITSNEWGYVADETGLGYYYHEEKEMYVITHLASGLSVGDLATQEQARAVIEQIAPLTDWTQPSKVLFALPELPAQVRSVYTAITGLTGKATKRQQRMVQLSRAIAEQAG